MNTPLPFRIGYGYDIHPFAENRTLILGGVEIPSDKGLAGHSDADVLSHAIADAILGALGLPDIGHYFPNTDPSIKGIDSQEILARAHREIESLGYTLGNIDATVVAEAPKISPHLSAMKRRLGSTLNIAQEAIGIKATTNEGLGSIGRAEGIAAHAVCLVIKK